MQAALDKASLYVNEDAPAFTGPGLEILARQYMLVMASIQRLCTTLLSHAALEKMLYMPALKEVDLHDVEKVHGWCEELQQRINSFRKAGERYEVKVETDVEKEDFVIHIKRLTHGILSSEQQIPSEFFASAEYGRIVALGEQLDGLLGS